MTLNLVNRTSSQMRPLRRSAIRHPPSAFTLVELLAVVAIIAILSGLLAPAIIAVRNRARNTLARTEVKTIEAAWRKYHAEYGQWPFCVTNEQEAFAITAPISQILQGFNNTDNPRQFVFMRFTNLDADGNPVNPWWKPGMPSTNHLYFVQFDANLDGAIDAGAPNPDPAVGARISRPVLVWTDNPRDPTNRTFWSWTP